MAIFKIGAKMFTLRVHSVDAPQPIPDDGFATATATSTSNRSSDFLERKGVLHLYRPIIDLSPSSSSPNPNPNRNPLLFVFAIPNYISSSDFIRFCEIDVVYISELVIIRNDALEDRYSALIKFEDQLRADAFFGRFNGKKFSFAERDWIKILLGYRVHFVIILFNVLAFLNGPISHARYVDFVSNKKRNQHALFVGHQHQRTSGFKDMLSSIGLILSIPTLYVWTHRVWDYVGDRYVHRLNQSRADGKMGTMNSHCLSLEGGCGTCGCSGCSEDSGISGALYNSEVEVIVDEYNRLMATQMEAQRKNYESLILEAKSKREVALAEAVENVVASRMLDIQYNLEKSVEERNAAADTRDLKISLEFRITLDNISDSDGGIKGVNGPTRSIISVPSGKHKKTLKINSKTKLDNSSEDLIIIAKHPSIGMGRPGA
ncbi:BRCA1-associated 2 [Dillenia turbinata]|uniref:BRCA1-associated 2 n=1 Tax=Dillenia turbinata TaxID=194707 RepID=A0AAN8WB77_9MAGN